MRPSMPVVEPASVVAVIVAPGIGALVRASRTTPSIGLAGLGDDRAIRAVIVRVDQARVLGMIALERGPSSG